MSSVRAIRTSAAYLMVLAAVFAVTPHALAEEPGIGLGTAESFAVLAATGITNTGATTVTGDIGSHPNGSFTNSGSFTLNGTNHTNDAVTQGAKEDLITAYNTAAGALPETEIAAELGEQTLKAGVYTSETGAFLLTGTLTLDAEGVRDAQFIFKTASTITTATNSTVRLINSADPCHVAWKIGSSATFNGGTTFVGDVLALISISAKAGATFEGRLLARDGAVTLINNTITAGACRAGTTVNPAPVESASTAPSSAPPVAATLRPAPPQAPVPAPAVTVVPGPLTPAGGPGAPDLTAGPGSPEVTSGPELPRTGWTAVSALLGLGLVALGVSSVRAGNACRPGRRALRHAR